MPVGEQARGPKKFHRTGCPSSLLARYNGVRRKRKEEPTGLRAQVGRLLSMVSS